jgi:NAD(P)-dependent dehydrogenase (short-subunit alcohol dehydrogenase family)
MASYESVEDGHSIIDAAVREFGRVDVLINNAGIVHHQDIETTTQADWDMVVGVNLTGSFKVIQTIFWDVSTNAD